MQPNEKIDFRKIRDFGGILSVTFDFLRQNFKKLFLSLILIAGPGILLSGILSGFTLSSIHKTSISMGNFWVKNLIHYIVLFFVSQLIVLVTYSYIDLYLDKKAEEFNVIDVWRRVLQNFGMFMITSIGVFILVLLATALLIIPGIYLSVVLTLMFIVRMREKLTFTEAVNRCRFLINGEWWFTLGLLITLVIIQIPFNFVLAIPTYAVVFFRTLHMQEGSSFAFEIFTIIASIIAAFNYIFYAITIIGITFHYYSIVEKKEATGLYEKLNSIDTQN